ncbi:MAG: SPOR domain-containing protein [Treponema sp.]|nr:SPOR domain-containing protein [Treponema sp.]
MKRVIPAVLGLFFAASLCMAQNPATRLRRVTAIQELRADGMSAAHSSFPIGSKVKVTNPANGLEIEVTVIEQIPGTDRQLIDLSPAAARALDIVIGGPVLVMPLLNQTRQESFAAEEAARAEPQILTEVEKNRQPEREPINITINNYVITPKSPFQSKNAPDNSPYQESQPAVTQPEPKSNNPEIPQYNNNYNNEIPEPAPEFDNSGFSKYIYKIPEPEPELSGFARPRPGEKASVFSSPPVDNIQIMPELPNPHTDKKYRLLVGSFSSLENAFLAYLQIQAAGFEAAQEQEGGLYRVFANGIPASMVYGASLRLGAIGFRQIWVQD